MAVLRADTKTPADWPALGRICSSCCDVMGIPFFSRRSEQPSGDESGGRNKIVINPDSHYNACSRINNY